MAWRDRALAEVIARALAGCSAEQTDAEADAEALGLIAWYRGHGRYLPTARGRAFLLACADVWGPSCAWLTSDACDDAGLSWLEPCDREAERPDSTCEWSPGPGAPRRCVTPSAAASIRALVALGGERLGSLAWDGGGHA
jgi:hypothetical protein